MNVVLPKPIWSVGITMYPPYEGERPREAYVFFELDKSDEAYYNEVVKTYLEMGIGVLSQRIRRGWHFMGEIRPDETRRLLQKRLQHLNFDGSLNTTLRIKRKSSDEIFEPAIWHGGERPNWCKSLQYFIALEARNEIDDYDKIAKRCGLYKYFKPQKGHHVIFYPLCPICLTSLPTEEKNELKHYQEQHHMFIEDKK